MRKSLAAATAEVTEQIGAWLAAARPAGDALKVVYLTGDLGAGKTTLARGFLREAGVRGAVKSPTYTLVETYRAEGAAAGAATEGVAAGAATEGVAAGALADRAAAGALAEGAAPGPLAQGAAAPPVTFVHLDLYRLIEPSELENLGLRDWAVPSHVWLVEWPERGVGHLPPADLVVRLVGGEPAHVIEIEAQSVLGEEWLAGVV